MTLGDLLALLRQRLDDNVEAYHYSDAFLTGCLNDAVRQAAIRKRLVLDRTTAEACTYTVAADQQAVVLHPRVLAIRSARFTDVTTPLKLTTLKVMDKDHPDWPGTTGAPDRLIVDAQSGSVLLWPTPETAGTLSLSVWRAPLDTEEMEGDDDEPVIDEVFHRDLIDWAEHLAYLTKDGEEGDIARSNAAENRFTAKFGRLPSAHEIKCWGLSPPRGQRAEFV